MNTTPVPETVSVWLIEDHDDFRRMVYRVINQIDGLACTRAFASCEETIAALKTEKPPHVILSDVGLPGINGIEGIKQIKEVAPATHVIMLTVYDDHEKVFQAICAGASGYLLKNSPEETITNAIQEVLRGGAPMNPQVAKKVLEMFAKIAPQPARDYGLSEREREILVLMSKGMMKKEIADKLSLSYHTVSNHLRSIYDKLHVHTHGGAVAKAMREKLL